MKNLFRYSLIIVFALIAGILASAFYQKFFVDDKTVSLQMPDTVQPDEQNRNENLDNAVISPEPKYYAETEAVYKTSALAELDMHKAKVRRDLNALRSEYAYDAPEVLDKQYELQLTQREIVKIVVLPEHRRSRLNLVYGKLLIRKIAAALELRQTKSEQARQKALKLKSIEKEITEYLIDLGETSLDSGENLFDSGKSRKF